MVANPEDFPQSIPMQSGLAGVRGWNYLKELPPLILPQRGDSAPLQPIV